MGMNFHCRGLTLRGMEDETPQPDRSEDGVDVSLIRWMLSLTPGERLEILQDHLNSILEIRELNAGS